MVFPPAILAVPVIDYSGVGESYDMIIGVDGSRVCNVLDFEDRMRNIQPGQTVYFNVVRNGKRMQVAVPITGLSTVASP
jgi:S1-C subfamily serine protease